MGRYVGPWPRSLSGMFGWCCCAVKTGDGKGGPGGESRESWDGDKGEKKSVGTELGEGWVKGR